MKRLRPGAPPPPAGRAELLTDYNGTGRWSYEAILERYLRHCRELNVEPVSIERLHSEGARRWRYPAMLVVIPRIDLSDPAAIALGVELVEEDQRMPFGRIMKANAARALRRAELTETQAERLRLRIVALLIRGDFRREFREYARLLKRIGVGPHWTAEIERDADRHAPHVARYLRFLGLEHRERAGKNV